MGLVNPTLPTAGEPNATEDIDVLNALVVLRNVINGNLDVANLADEAVEPDKLLDELAEQLGVSSGGVTRSGQAIIPGTEVRANAAYGKLATPDEVTVTLPQDGRIEVLYQATWQESVSGAARAAIFVGANQLKATSRPAPTVQETGTGGAVAAQDYPLACSAKGLISTLDSVAYTGDVATGQLVGTTPADLGGIAYVLAAAGTYTVSVQFKASAGSVTAKNRKLWVRAIA